MMKLKTVTEEELETMSYDDVAYVILKESGNKMKLIDLFNAVCEVMKLDQSVKDEYIADFWDTHYKNIKQWYLEQKESTDVIISASPEFLLKPLEKQLKVNVIASIVDKKTGKFLSKNCHDYEKIKRYEEKYKKKIKAFYSDSIKADRAMLEYAKKAYLVTKDKVEEIDIKNM